MIRKYLWAGNLPNLNLDWSALNIMPWYSNGNLFDPNYSFNLPSTPKYGTSSIIGKTSSTSNATSNAEDNEIGRALGNIFSTGLNSAGNKLFNNVIKGDLFSKGVMTDTASSMAGSAAGLGANLIGQGISSSLGNSRIGQGLGTGVSTALGTIGGTVASNLLKTGSVAGNASKLFGTGNSIWTTTKTAKDVASNLTKTTVGAINPYALGASVIGNALGAITGGSKEYGGRYGNITRSLDTAYDAISGVANFVPGVGQGISAAMVLNKGLSNIFGSTSGMTRTDAILGSAFMPAPVKWLNMLGSSKTGTFDNQSWQNSEKANSFMLNGFGNLNEKFQLAMEEAGKTYGTFSKGARNRALRNLDFANTAWELILDMARLNEIQGIRSLDMTSINNLRYALMIQGGWNPIYRGKMGMKILNNSINHNLGLRYLSAAALIDNKLMILCALGGVKVPRRPRMKAHRKGEQPTYTEEELKLIDAWNAYKEQKIKEREAKIAKRNKTNAVHAAKLNLLAGLIQTSISESAEKAPFTGLLYQQAVENLRLEKIEKFHEKAEELVKGFEAATAADLVHTAAPLLGRVFRWAFDKTGNLIRVPLEKTNLFMLSPYTGKWTLFGSREYRFKPGIAASNGVPIESRPISLPTSHVQGDEAVKMFKEYGGYSIPEGSINGELLRKYVSEARERYGLVGNTAITDEEIAQSLYKHSKELGENTAAVNALGEPLLLFRGSTKRNTVLHPKGTGEQSISGADNILGNLFLGELPGTRSGQGLERYLGLNYGWLGPQRPGTNAAEVIGDKISYPLFNTERFGTVSKLAPESMEFGANDINAFVVRTPKVRDATEEIVVVNGVEAIPKNKLLGSNLSEHYRNLVKDAESKGQGLLRSDPLFEEITRNNPITGDTWVEKIPKFRDEHENYTYFALPNFNIRNAKHLIPFDLRIPRNWRDPNIYKSAIPLTIGGFGYEATKQ